MLVRSSVEDDAPPARPVQVSVAWGVPRLQCGALSCELVTSYAFVRILGAWLLCRRERLRGCKIQLRSFFPLSSLSRSPLPAFLKSSTTASSGAAGAVASLAS